ncbi:Ldh family oxidoreductase [Achromobacter aloeverae]|uniref:Ldh family oxidoreductase n=1 Tax=Achromobacter aloeverae TaxID=1750518 RepID=UPI00361CF854
MAAPPETARQRREQIPLGWALDADGAPTTDPEAAINGIILPMAHHKGYAIATLVDVLSGVLSGSQFLSGVSGPYHYDKRSGAGHFLTVYDVDAFMDRTEFDQRMERFITEIKSQPLAQGFDEIFYRGEMEARAAERHLRDGLPIRDRMMISSGRALIPATRASPACVLRTRRDHRDRAAGAHPPRRYVRCRPETRP